MSRNEREELEELLVEALVNSGALDETPLNGLEELADIMAGAIIASGWPRRDGQAGRETAEGPYVIGIGPDAHKVLDAAFGIVRERDDR